MVELSNVRGIVRDLVQDAGDEVRYTDDSLDRFVTQTLGRMAVLKPDLFSEIVDAHPTVAGKFIQSCPKESVRLVEVYSAKTPEKDGPMVLEITKTSETLSGREWIDSGHAGVCTQFMRHPRNPNAFFISPVAPAKQTLTLEYIKSPEIVDGKIPLPKAFESVLIDGTVFMVDSINDEYANSARAQMYLKLFTQGLGISTQNRIMIDNEDGAIAISNVHTESFNNG